MANNGNSKRILIIGNNESAARAGIPPDARFDAEQALRESEERLRVLGDNLPDSAVYQYMYDADGTPRFLYVSSGIEHLNGVKVEDVLRDASALLDQILPEYHTALVQAEAASARDLSDFEMDVQMRRPDDGVRWMRLRSRPRRLPDGRVVWDGVQIDITERKRAEVKLEQHKDLLTTVTANTKALLAYMDRDFNFIWVNPAYAKADDRTQEELVGRNHFELYPNEENKAIFEQVRDTGMPFEILEKPFVYPDNPERGTTYWDWTLTPVKDDSAAVQSLVLSLVDVTHDVLARQEIAAARSDAERHAAELEAFFSHMADAVVLFDAEPKVLMFNDAAIKLVGAPPDMPAEEWGPQHELFTLEGEPVPLAEYPSRLALRGLETKDARFRMVTPWSESLVSINGSPVRDADGTVIGGTLSLRDVAKLVKMEQQKDELYERESHIATTLQQALVPPSVPEEINGYRFAVKYKPALREAEIGGDFYDVFDLGDGRVCVIIGDVAGKGLRAAMRVASARYAIRGCAFIEAKPSRILALANESLCCGTEPENDMLTAFLAIIDTRVGAVIYSSAGHEPPVLLHPDGQTEELLGRGVPLGIMPGFNYTEGTCRLNPGSRIVMVTDGITEARTSSVELFEKQRVIDYVRNNGKSPLQDVVDGLLQAATAYAGGELQDDAAIVAIEQYDGKGV